MKDSTAIRWVVSSRCLRNLKLAAYEQDLFFFWGTPHISFFTWISIRHFPLCKCKQNSFSRHCNARLSAVKVWNIIENRVCAAVVHGFSKPRTTFECIYTNTFTSKVSRGLDKPIPKPLGQDKPAAAWAGHGLNKPWTQILYHLYGYSKPRLIFSGINGPIITFIFRHL